MVRVPDATWIRLTFDQVVLGSAPDTARETNLRITSVADGAVGILDLLTRRGGLANWG